MATTSAATKRPNFLVILTDDMGYSDCGCFGGEVHTPNIDNLASVGVRLADFHTAAACAPSRSMLMTGTDHHIAGIGNMMEWLTGPAYQAASTKGGPDIRLQRGKPGYEGYLNERVVTAAEVLGDAGYQTLMAGKWHLGLRPETAPSARGFERSFAHLPASSNHYAYEPQFEQEASTYFKKNHATLHDEDGKYVMKLPEGWYSTTGYTDKLLGYLDDREKTSEERPFFAYLAYTAPHWPLQAPRHLIDLYKGKYSDGPAALRERRLKRMAELGIIDGTQEAHPLLPLQETPWESLDATEQANSCRAMEIYAAMLHCVDENIGRVLDKLRAQGELDNTFVLFCSDNGPDGSAYEAYPVIQTRLNEHVRTPGYFDNSLANLGNYNSFIWYGSAWAQAASAPHRLFKAFSTEGGCRVPAIVKFPTSIPAASGSAPGSISPAFSTVMDMVPTVLDLAGVPHPTPSFQGRTGIAPMRGASMVPWYRGTAPSIHATEFVQGWELCGRAALRKGNWKLNFVPPPAGPGRWELHDLAADRGEVKDLAEANPDKMRELLTHWDAWMAECNVIGIVPELVGPAGTVVVPDREGRKGPLAILPQPEEEQLTIQGWVEYEWFKSGAKLEPQKFFGPTMPALPTKPVAE